MPTFTPNKLRQATPRDYALRFGFGGAVTLLTGLVAHEWGPEIGGLFLAFPAILPAALTLVEEHDGRRQAIESALGAALGSVGLAAFAIACARFADALPPPAILAGAMLAWMVICFAAWGAVFGRRRPPDTRAPRSARRHGPTPSSGARRSAPARRRGRR